MSTTETSSASELAAALAAPRSRRRRLIGIAAVVLALAALAAFALRGPDPAAGAIEYVTATVTHGNLDLTVTANGTLQPTRSVAIGSELSGTVSRVLVDVNDRVKRGQVLVELDTAKLADQVARARAALASANAKVAQAVATRKEAEGNLARLKEVQRLSGGKVPSTTELESGQANVDRAIADEAAARATVVDATAALSTDETNLAKASIRSPIDGIVLTRAVDPGNAVAASLQAVTLFTIAEDLSRMKLEVKVDEADVGLVGVGQDATFTVSAYSSRHYPAKVTRVAYGSTITDNVVTYVTTLDVANADLTLRPGMTATATMRASARRDALLVPNAALRYAPAASAAAPAASGGGLVASLMPRPPSGPPKSAGAATGAGTGGPRRVYVLRDGVPVAVPVTTGATDGKLTEVAANDLSAGTPVIVDQQAKRPS